MRKLLSFAVICFLGLSLGSLRAQAPAATPDENPEGNTGALKAQVTTGGSYDAHSGNATRSVNDLHVPGALGVYGLDFTRYWNSNPNDYDNADAVLPISFGNSGWSHSWEWHAIYGYQYPEEILGTDTDNNAWVTSITITFPDGHANRYKITRPGHGIYSGGVLIPGDPRFGPPYSAPEQNGFFTNGAVYDVMGDMAADGSEFWLYRADGGSVHFQGSSDGYLATEIFDPHGLRTQLDYDVNGRVTHVEQDGGRSLTITWGPHQGSVVPLIDRVDTGGAAGSETVFYEYASTSGSPTLWKVDYPEGAHAIYTYQNCYEDYPCSADDAPFPLLKIADDPHYGGAMTKIRYTYRGSTCQIQDQPRPGFEPYQNAKLDYYLAPATAIAVEKSDYADQFGPIAVSSFAIGCFSGTRMETNGLGGWRMFYFGRSAGQEESSAGYQLVRLTDFTNQYPFPPSLPFERQRGGNTPSDVWDGRNIRTSFVYAGYNSTTGQFGDSSGQPSEIHHVTADGSVHRYDRVNPGASDARDPALIHNPFNHWVFSQTDERGLTTTYRRDSRRRVVDVTYPDNSSEHFTYNDWNQVVTHTLPSGAVVTYVYDDTTHRLLVESNSVDGSDARKEYTYYAVGESGGTLDLVKTVCDGRSRSAGKDFSTRMTYNGRHQVLTVEYAGMNGAPDNPKVQYGYDDHGNCNSITDEMGHTSYYDYDDYRRCISYREPLNRVDWNGAGWVPERRWDWIYDRYIPEVGLLRDSHTHTKNEWRIQIEPAFNAAGERKMTARWHDLQNRIIQEQTGWIQPPGPIGNWYWSVQDGETHYFSYDANGQKKTYTDPLNRVTSYTYDNRNRLYQTIEPLNRVTATQYDTTGNKTLVTLPDNQTQQWLDYDPFGQAGRFIDERGNTTHLTYCWGPMKKLNTVTTHRDKDGGGTEDQPTHFDYDGMGRPKQVLFPDGSHEDSTYECKDSVGYFCDQVHTWRTRKGQIKTIVYDARGREQSHSWNDGLTPPIVRSWDDANRLTSIANSVSTIDYQYDSAAQPLYEGNTITGSGGRVQTTFYRYGNGELANLVYPAGPWARHDYNARGQLQTAGVADGSGNWAFQLINYHYLQDGKVEHQDYGNGTSSTFTYDGRGFMRSVRHTAGNQELASRTYWRDTRDRITAMQKGSGNAVNAMEDGRGNGYSYDPEGELYYVAYGATIDGNGNATSPIAGEDYFQYDALGNRRSYNLVHSHGWTEILRKDNGLNQYRSWSPNSIAYDDDFGPPWGSPGQANGVMMMEGNITASYNALNQPIAIWSPVYSGTPNYMWFGYDPLGRCVKRWVGPYTPENYPAYNANPATYMYYDGWSLIQEGGSASSPTRLYVQGNRIDELAVTFNVGAGQYGFHHYDSRGDCILLTSLGGGIMEQYYIDAFGVPFFYDAGGGWIGGQSPFGNRFLFTGREWLQDLRVYDFRNRMYQPELGRFLQPDPKEFAAGDYNLYRYCHNDPVNKTDPTGLADTAEDRKLLDENLKKLKESNAAQAAKDTKLVRDAAAKAAEKVTGDKNAGTNIAQHNKDHAKVVDRNKLDTSKWQPSRSSHSESAHETSIPDSSKYVLKAYDNDRGTGTTTINVTTPMSLGHVIDAIRYNLGSPVNAEYAADYLGVNR